MTLLEKINKLNYVNLINKLKDILKGLNDKPAVDSRPYKVYTALLTQTETDAPVATVLENTLGEDVIWSYETVGIYKGSLSSGFDLNKTYYSAGGNIHYLTSFETGITLNFDNKIRITNKKMGIFSDNDLYYYPVEIRVYN